jgi:hypothetical protein
VADGGAARLGRGWSAGGDGGERGDGAVPGRSGAAVDRRKAARGEGPLVHHEQLRKGYMLHKEMLKKLTDVGEKESVYSKWGIDLSTNKQRRLRTQSDAENVRTSERVHLLCREADRPCL